MYRNGHLKRKNSQQKLIQAMNETHVLVDCCISAQQINIASQFLKTDDLEYNQPLIAGGGNLAAKGGAS